MTDQWAQAILTYYAIMWLTNVAAYSVMSAGLYRWLKFVKGMQAERLVRLRMKITTGFAAARLIAGLIGIGLFETGYTGPLETVLLLGITSLFLNTTFLMSEGRLLYRDSDKAWHLPPDEQVTLREAVEVFNRLRRTANAR